MLEINFLEEINDSLLEYAVIIAKHKNSFVFCKHKKRTTFELPGGHREVNENILETAKRELYEETGAIEFKILPICVYSVFNKNTLTTNYGMLFFAEIFSFNEKLENEIEQIILSENLITNWTYPLIQPKLIEEAHKRKIL